MKKVTIIDYGVGNLLSLKMSLEYLGAEVTITKEKDLILESSHIILPGVGGFSDFISKLKENNLLDFLRDFHSYEDKFLLGICVGMQVLGDISEEGEGEGLSLISGSIKLIEDSEVKIPHMGWNSIEINSDDDIFNDIDISTGFYFLHSYYFYPKDKSHSISNFEYNKKTYPAFIKHKNVYGSQGHPEKSHDNGSRLIKNFCGLVNA